MTEINGIFLRKNFDTRICMALPINAFIALYVRRDAKFQLKVCSDEGTGCSENFYQW